MENHEISEEAHFSGMTEKQKKIFESALEIFAEKGFSGTSTGEIAKKAGVAEGLIFKHFKNKKLLFQKIAFLVIEKLIIPLTVQRTKKFLGENYTDIRVFLTLFFQERLDFVQKHQSFLRIFIQDLPIDRDLQIFARDQFEKTMYPIVREFIERHQRAGIIKPIEPEIIIRMVITSFFGYAFLKFILFPEHAWNDERQIQQTIEIIANGISI